MQLKNTLRRWELKKDKQWIGPSPVKSNNNNNDNFAYHKYGQYTDSRLTKIDSKIISRIWSKIDLYE